MSTEIPLPITVDVTTPKKRGRKKKEETTPTMTSETLSKNDDTSVAISKPKRTIRAPKSPYEPIDPRITKKRHGSGTEGNGDTEGTKKVTKRRKSKSDETEKDETENKNENKEEPEKVNESEKEEDKAHQVKSTPDSMQYEGGSNQAHMTAEHEHVESEKKEDVSSATETKLAVDTAMST